MRDFQRLLALIVGIAILGMVFIINWWLPGWLHHMKNKMPVLLFIIVLWDIVVGGYFVMIGTRAKHDNAFVTITGMVVSVLVWATISIFILAIILAHIRFPSLSYKIGAGVAGAFVAGIPLFPWFKFCLICFMEAKKAGRKLD